jgi:hypothetical protein
LQAGIHLYPDPGSYDSTHILLLDRWLEGIHVVYILGLYRKSWCIELSMINLQLQVNGTTFVHQSHEYDGVMDNPNLHCECGR